MPPPFKKRMIQKNAIDTSSTDSSLKGKANDSICSDSEPSFASPVLDSEEDDDFSMHDIEEEDEDSSVKGVPHKSFQAPIPDDEDEEEDGSILGSPGFSTQPQTIAARTTKRNLVTTESSVKSKKRKVSLSPQQCAHQGNQKEPKIVMDSLGQMLPQRRRSPRSATRAAVDSVTLDIDILRDDNEVIEGALASTGKPPKFKERSSKTSASSKVTNIEMASTKIDPLGHKPSSSNNVASAKELPIATKLFSSQEVDENIHNSTKQSNKDGNEVSKAKTMKSHNSKSKSTLSKNTYENMDVPVNKIKIKSGSMQLPEDDSALATSDTAALKKVEATSKSETPSESMPKRKQRTSGASTVQSTQIAKTMSSKSSKQSIKAPSDESRSTSTIEKTATKVSAKASADNINKKKKKKKKSFQDQLLHLLFMSCKPYTVKTLAQEMKGGASESAIEFCFLSLVDKKWVMKKVFSSKSGRTKELYWANHECHNKELMDILDFVPPHRLEQTKQEYAQLQAKEVAVTKDLADLLKEPSNAELQAKLDLAETENQALQARLLQTHDRIRAAQNSLSQSSGKRQNVSKGFGRGALKKGPIKVRSSLQLKKKINDFRLQWKKRKEKCMDFVENLADAMEKKVKDVVKSLELETDEDAGAKMPSKYDV